MWGECYVWLIGFILFVEFKFFCLAVGVLDLGVWMAVERVLEWNFNVEIAVVIYKNWLVWV